MSAPRPAHQQAEEGLLTYGGYLKVPELLALQQVQSDPTVHDELLFIVVHQAYGSGSVSCCSSWSRSATRCSTGIRSRRGTC